MHASTLTQIKVGLQRLTFIQWRNRIPRLRAREGHNARYTSAKVLALKIIRYAMNRDVFNSRNIGWLFTIVIPYC